MTGTEISSKVSPYVRSFSRLLSKLLALGALLASAPLSYGQYKLCFPSGTWFGNPAPNLNSFKVNDPGWINSFRYVFGNGTSAPQYAVVQGIRDSSNNLFLSFEGEGLTTLGQTASTTVVIVALDFRQSAVDAGPLYLIELSPVINNAPTNPPSDPASAVGVPSGT